MHYLRISLLVFLSCVSACGPKPTRHTQPISDERTAPPKSVESKSIPASNVAPPPTPLATPTPVDPNDPAEVQRRFVKTVTDTIKRAEPDLKKPIAIQMVDDEQHTYFAEYSGKYSYDIKKSDSIVSPYLGTVSWSVLWYHNGQAAGPMTFDARYAYQDGRWVIKDLSRSFEGGERLPATEYLQFFK